TLTFRKSYDALLTQQPGRADKEYVRLLHLATQEGETAVETALAQLLAGQRPLSAQAVQTLLGRDTPLSWAAGVEVAAVDWRQYDALLDEFPEAAADRGLSAVESRQEASHDQ